VSIRPSVRHRERYGDEEAALRFGAVREFVRSFSRVKGRFGTVFVLLAPTSHNYYHWINDHHSELKTFFLAQRFRADR
jgi:hypothetical protein